MYLSVKALIGVLLVFFVLSVSPAAGEEPQAEIALSVVSGTVTAVDWVGGRMVVRTFRSGQADEISFMVPDGTAVGKGTSEITFGNINIADKVTVQYYGNLSGLRAVRITVK